MVGMEMAIVAVLPSWRSIKSNWKVLEIANGDDSGDKQESPRDHFFLN